MFLSTSDKYGKKEEEVHVVESDRVGLKNSDENWERDVAQASLGSLLDEEKE